ncbi:MAG: hypothetical protein MJ252_18205 [archaeon]|nr:hypothetical protein [archaeon]
MSEACNCSNCMRLKEDLKEKGERIQSLERNLFNVKSKLTEKQNLNEINVKLQKENERLGKLVKEHEANQLSNEDQFKITVLEERVKDAKNKYEAIKLNYEQAQAYINQMEETQFGKKEEDRLKRKISEKDKTINEQNYLLAKLKKEKEDLEAKFRRKLHKTDNEPLFSSDEEDMEPKEDHKNEELLSDLFMNRSLGTFRSPSISFNYGRRIPQQDKRITEILNERDAFEHKYNSTNRKYHRYKDKYELLKKNSEFLYDIVRSVSVGKKLSEKLGIDSQLNPNLLKQKRERSKSKAKDKKHSSDEEDSSENKMSEEDMDENKSLSKESDGEIDSSEIFGPKSDIMMEDVYDKKEEEAKAKEDAKKESKKKRRRKEIKEEESQSQSKPKRRRLIKKEIKEEDEEPQKEESKPKRKRRSKKEDKEIKKEKEDKEIKKEKEEEAPQKEESKKRGKKKIKEEEPNEDIVIEIKQEDSPKSKEKPKELKDKASSKSKEKSKEVSKKKTEIKEEKIPRSLSKEDKKKRPASSSPAVIKEEKPNDLSKSTKSVHFVCNQPNIKSSLFVSSSTAAQSGQHTKDILFGSSELNSKKESSKTKRQNRKSSKDIKEDKYISDKEESAEQKMPLKAGSKNKEANIIFKTDTIIKALSSKENISEEKFVSLFSDKETLTDKVVFLFELIKKNLKDIDLGYSLIFISGFIKSFKKVFGITSICYNFLTSVEELLKLNGPRNITLKTEGTEYPYELSSLKENNSLYSFAGYIIDLLFKETNDVFLIFNFSYKILFDQSHSLNNLEKLFNVLKMKESECVDKKEVSDTDFNSFVSKENESNIYSLQNYQNKLVTKRIFFTLLKLAKTKEDAERGKILAEEIRGLIMSIDSTKPLPNSEQFKVNDRELTYLQIFQLISLMFIFKEQKDNYEWIFKDIYSAILWSNFALTRAFTLKRTSIIYLISYLFYLCNKKLNESTSTYGYEQRAKIYSWLKMIIYQPIGFDESQGEKKMSSNDKISALSWVIQVESILSHNIAVNKIKNVLKDMNSLEEPPHFPRDFLRTVQNKKLI